ncbi:MAG: Helix-turn-helix domain [Candidatus Atribacteria bacterium]|nr:Helix-turn-helix domain [Candidatus Atribacteria bacterium]
MAVRWTKLKELRLKAGLPQWQLAFKVNIPETTFSKIENGHLPLSYELAEKIAEVLSVPVEEILEEENTLASTLQK